jgi:hypothetical protein
VDRGKTRTTYAHLTVLSDVLSAAELEAALDMSPDLAWSKGDPHQEGKRQRRYNGVSFESALDREQGDPSEHIEDLLHRLSRSAQRIRAVVEDSRVHRAALWLHWNTSADNPRLTFPSKTVQTIAALGVSLDLDISVLGDDD